MLTLTTEMLAPDGSARWRRKGQIDLTGPDAERRARALGLELGQQVHAAAGDQRVAV
jgi:hydroxymethylbilane synthase